MYTVLGKVVKCNGKPEVDGVEVNELFSLFEGQQVVITFEDKKPKRDQVLVNRNDEVIPNPG